MDVEGPGGNRGGPGAPGGPGFPSSLSGPLPEYSSSTNYTIPGILHFIKHEWSRFEKERTNWEVQKSELQAKIAFLQGERKGHENLMHDLVRRIKMLEFALKQERAKLYKAVHGKELVFSDMKPPSLEPENNRPQLDVTTVATQREESRKILRDYLREVGFPDNVLEARVARMTAYKNLYGQNQLMEQPSSTNTNRSESPPANIPSFPSYTPPPPPPTSAPSSHVVTSLPNGPMANGTDMQAQGSTSTFAQRDSSPSHPLDSRENKMETGEEEDVNEVLSSYGFLDNEDDDDDDDEEEEGETSAEWVPNESGLLPFEIERSIEDDKSTEAAMDEFQEGSLDIKSTEYAQQRDIYTQNKPRKKKLSTERPSRKKMAEYKASQTNSSEAQQIALPPPAPMGMMQMPGRSRVRGNYPGLDLVPGADSTFEAAALGELAFIPIEDKTTITETSRKWDHKFTLQSHFDSIRSVAFHPTEQVVLTGSEDCTLKLWNLQRARQKARENRRTMLVDVEALHTFRGHRGAVLSVAFGLGGEVCYSGGADSTIRVWRVPEESEDDPFSVYDPDVHQGVLTGHCDAVWGLAVHNTTGLVLSCAGDGTCRLWDHHQTSPQVQEFKTEERFGNPTSIDFVWTNMHHMVASYQAAKIMTFDLETGQCVTNLDSGSTYDGTPQTQINHVVCHPTLPIVVSAHEDKYIKFYDVNTGKLIHYMTGHMDSVSGLAIDQHGQYLLSGGHDGSLRFWSMDTKKCIQEVGGAHRKRFDESICKTACHSSEPFFASAGADGIAKVYA